MNARFERRVQLLSSGPLFRGSQQPEPGRPGKPQIYHNGLGRFFVGRPVLDSSHRVTIEYAPDPDGILERTATNIRRGRFGDPKYDQDSTFPLTRRLAFLAYPELRPKNQPEPLDFEERMALKEAHWNDRRAIERDLPIQY